MFIFNDDPTQFNSFNSNDLFNSDTFHCFVDNRLHDVASRDDADGGGRGGTLITERERERERERECICERKEENNKLTNK